MTSVLDGKGFRSGLERIAGSAKLNLWLDRRVDPSRLIQAGPVGPTVFAALQQLAETQNCVVMPVGNVIVVGRESWVDMTAARVLMASGSKSRELIDVSWDDLTTPNEALLRIAGGRGTRQPTLPHDLWPATRWQGVERQVALALVLAQFEGDSGRRADDPAELQPVTRRYGPSSKMQSIVRETMSTADKQSRVRSNAGWIVARGIPMAHRLATKKIMESAASAGGPDPDRDTFTLKKLTTSAENAFRQLARSAQRDCVIDDSAVEACQSVITVEGTDMTLRQLIKVVADKAGVVAKWQGNAIMITKP